MGLSSALLIVSVVAAAAALAMSKLQVPSSLIEGAKALAVAAAVALSGLAVVATQSSITVFGLTHAVYLCAVVGAPIVLGVWAAVGWRREARPVLVVGAGLLGVLLAGTGVYATHIEPNRLRVERVTLESATMSGSLRIGVLADLQTPNIGQHERDAVQKLLAAEPDLVVIPGDFYQGSRSVIAANRQDFVDLLATLVAGVEVVVVVSGDSDLAAGLEPMAVDAGAIFLNNAVTDTMVAGVNVRLVGVDVTKRPLRLGRVSEILTSPSDLLTIVVSHRPDVVFNLPPDADVDLVVAGHTHGGQVALPFFGPLVTFSNVPRSVAAGGLGEVAGFPIYVSTGVGLERRQAPQVRFGVRPSVGIIEIVPTT